MEYVDELKNFEELYNMFIYKGEASVFLDTVKKLHLEEAYMTWLNDHFKDTVPAKSTIEYCITHEWDDFRMHIPYLTLSRFTPLMKTLVDSMDDLERIEALTFPMTFSKAELPSGGQGSPRKSMIMHCLSRWKSMFQIPRHMSSRS